MNGASRYILDRSCTHRCSFRRLQNPGVVAAPHPTFWATKFRRMALKLDKYLKARSEISKKITYSKRILINSCGNPAAPMLASVEPMVSLKNDRLCRLAKTKGKLTLTDINFLLRWCFHYI